ncbi:hypothetical protein ID866_12228 [Astraeus odoratus]|nr:hypothetical protein ID866_12228 [Astraeus odoratus]
MRDGLCSNRPSTAQIMSWAADRKTTREEDRAYSLLGLFGVHMPMLYGEGKHAFQRLQREIIRMSNDHSIFAWDPKGRLRQTGSVLADDPSFFRDCHDIEKMEPDEFIEALKEDIPEEELPAVTDERLHSFTVTNGGIHIWLPVSSSHDRPSVLQITLACRREDDSSPVTIDLAAWKSVYYRYYCATEITMRMSEFRQLLLGDRDEENCDFAFTLDHRTVPHYNFSCRGAFPREVSATGDAFTLTSINPLAIMDWVLALAKNGYMWCVTKGPAGHSGRDMQKRLTTGYGMLVQTMPGTWPKGVLGILPLISKSSTYIYRERFGLSR